MRIARALKRTCRHCEPVPATGEQKRCFVIVVVLLIATTALGILWA